MLINVKIPTFVGILTFMSMKKFYNLGAWFQGYEFSIGLLTGDTSQYVLKIISKLSVTIGPDKQTFGT